MFGSTTRRGQRPVVAEYLSHALREVPPGSRVGPYSNGYQKTFDTDRVWEISMSRIVTFHNADPAPHRIMQKQASEAANPARPATLGLQIRRERVVRMTKLAYVGMTQTVEMRIRERM